jgi:DNA-binding transcriptional MerR regulator
MMHSELPSDVVRFFAPYINRAFDTRPELFDSLPHKTFSAKETGVHPRVMADWNTKGLLLAPHVKNRMHRFTLTEFVWIRIVERLRRFNFPFDLIKAFRDSLMGTLEVDFESLVADKETFEALAKALDPSNPENAKVYLSNPDNIADFRRSYKNFTPTSSALDGIVVMAVVLGHPLLLLMDDEGKGVLFSPVLLEEDHPEKDEVMKMLCGPHLSISITEILAQLVTLVPLDKISGSFHLLSSQEAKVLDVLREEGLRSVTVRFDGRGEMEFLELTSDHKVDKRARLFELMLTTGYQDITVKTQNGDVVFCQNTRKIKLK